MDSLVPANVLHRLISSKDVALRLGVSQATVLRAVARGLLRPALITPGGHRRFSPGGVETLAEGLQGDPNGGPPVATRGGARLLGGRQPTLHPDGPPGGLRPTPHATRGH